MQPEDNAWIKVLLGQNWITVSQPHHLFEFSYHGVISAMKKQVRWQLQSKMRLSLTAGKHQVFPAGKIGDKSVPGEATVIVASWISWIPQRLFLLYLS